MASRIDLGAALAAAAGVLVVSQPLAEFANSAQGVFAALEGREIELRPFLGKDGLCVRADQQQALFAQTTYVVGNIRIGGRDAKRNTCQCEQK